MTPRRQSGFTLIELLVVIGVIGILIGAIITVGSSVIAGGKARDTQAMLMSLNLAIEQFKEDMLERPRFSGNAKKDYDARYAADYPPDELEVFTAASDLGAGFLVTIAPGTGANLVNANESPLDIDSDQVKRGRSTKAMALAIRLYSEAGAEILDKISERFRKSEGNDQRLKRSAGFDVFEPLVYFVDSWGTPIEYFATSDPARAVSATTTDVGDKRRDASTVFLAANNGVPLLVSYGPDGPDQFSADFMATEGETDLVADFWDDIVLGKRPINHPLNADNVYSNPEFADKLAAGLPDPPP